MIEEYFTPVDIAVTQLYKHRYPRNLGGEMRIYVDEFPSLEDIDLAIIGVKEGRGSWENDGCESAPDEVRRHLYCLKKPVHQIKIADLGNLEAAQSLEQTADYLQKVMVYLLKRNIMPVILGGSKQLAYAMFAAYENLRDNVELVCIDPRIELEGETYLKRIMLHEPNYLFNLSMLAYQSYFVEPEFIEVLEKMYFDHRRLGSLRADMEEAEPILRNADMVVLDIAAVKQADSPAHAYVSPNGLTGEEICQLTRYAGVSNRVSSFGLFEINPALDQHGQSAKLAAHMLWYFVDGFYARSYDNPQPDSEEFTRYRISLKNSSTRAAVLQE